MLEHARPHRPVAGGEIEIGAAEILESLRRRVRSGRHEGAELLDKLALPAVERLRLHREDERVEIGKHIVDRADGAADLRRQFPRLQARKAMRLDRVRRRFDQRLPQLLGARPAFVNHDIPLA